MIKDRKGEIVKELDSHALAEYVLADGEQYDFSNFERADLFVAYAKPIKTTFSWIKTCVDMGVKTEILTARSDVDNPKEFLGFLSDCGLPMDKIHVRRAGNRMTGAASIAKKMIISEAIDEHNYERVMFVDDSIENIRRVQELRNEYKDTKFYLYKVEYYPATEELFITDH